MDEKITLLIDRLAQAQRVKGKREEELKNARQRVERLERAQESTDKVIDLLNRQLIEWFGDGIK